MKSSVCEYCNEQFPSRRKLFIHLKTSDCNEHIPCLPREDISKRIAILFGYCDESNVEPLLKGKFDDLKDFDRATRVEDSEYYQKPLKYAAYDIITYNSTMIDKQLSKLTAENLNKLLPSSIRVFSVETVPKTFRALSAKHRIFEYIIPYDFLSRGQYDKSDAGWLKMSQKIDSILDYFKGRKCFHNFTSDLTPTAPQAFLNIYKLFCKRKYFRKDKFDMNADCFLIFTFCAKFFLQSQIQYMISLIVAIFHDLIPKEFLEYAFDQDQLCTLPTKAPLEYLIFSKPVYGNFYTNWVGQKKIPVECRNLKGQIYQSLSKININILNEWYISLKKSIKDVCLPKYQAWEKMKERFLNFKNIQLDNHKLPNDYKKLFETFDRT
eukprot:UN24878